MYLVSTSSTLEGASDDIGLIVGPRVGGIRAVKEGRRFAADNDAYHGKFTEKTFLTHLRRLTPYQDNCLFVAAPDVCSDAHATEKLFEHWGPRIRSLGFPVAWVAQNGAKPTDIPEHCDAVFIGGDTTWKLGSEALAICEEASKRGLWIHMGRVNSAKRCLIAAQMRANSVDGTHLAFTGTQKGLYEIEGWVGKISGAPLQMRLI